MSIVGAECLTSCAKRRGLSAPTIALTGIESRSRTRMTRSWRSSRIVVQAAELLSVDGNTEFSNGYWKLEPKAVERLVYD